MRKFLVNGLAIVAGVVSLPSPVSHLQFHGGGVPDTTPSEYREDPRLESLQRFFRLAGCPAVRLASVFLQAADDYDLDWRLLPSISFVESTGGKAAPHNNMFGWDAGRAVFATMAESIHVVGFRLAHSARYRDKDLDDLLEAYNPNADYARRVKAIMRRIAPSEDTE